jgi:hypothetical protein
MLAFGAAVISLVASYINVHFLGSALTFMMAYVWGRRNEDVRVRADVRPGGLVRRARLTAKPVLRLLLQHFNWCASAFLDQLRVSPFPHRYHLPDVLFGIFDV